MVTSIKEEQCRNCKAKMVDVLNLGELYPSQFIDKKPGIEKQPLVLAQCTECGLVQLRHTINLDLMYREYWYKSGLNKTMIGALRDVYNGVNKRIKKIKYKSVLDLGANDGTLLSMYNDDVFKVGVDPALNLHEEASKKCDIFINDYFDLELLRDHTEKTFDVVTSIAMFYDLPDPNKFIEDVKAILNKNGIWVIQFTDLMSMLKLNEIGNLCMEHLEYYSLQFIVDIMYKHNLDVFDVEYNTVNGGSLRVYVGHMDDYRITNNVVYALQNEKLYFRKFDNPIKAFANRAEALKERTLGFLADAKRNRKKIYGIGASTKGNTLLQYYGIGPGQITAIGEVNEDKFGLKTVGSNIPIIPEREVLEINPDYLFILPFHFKDFFMEEFKQYRRNGGQLVFPLPTLQIV